MSDYNRNVTAGPFGQAAGQTTAELIVLDHNGRRLLSYDPSRSGGDRFVHDFADAKATKIAGGQVRMSYDIDTSLVGGVTLRVGDRLIDGSVKGRLARMRERILSAAG